MKRPPRRRYPDLPSEDFWPHRSWTKASPSTRRRSSSIYRTMYLSRRIDDKEIQLKRQNRIFFQISGAGHEAVLVAAGMVLRAGLRLVLPLLPRPRALLQLGVTPYEMFLAAVGAADDPALGRPADAVPLGLHRACNIVTRPPPPAPSSCRRWAAPRPASTSARATPAAPAAGASRRDEVVYCSAGRRHDLRGRVLGEPQHRLQPQAARALPHRGQRLRDLRPRGGADRGRQHLEARARRSPTCSCARWTAAIPWPAWPCCARRRPGAAPAAGPPSSTPT